MEHTHHDGNGSKKTTAWFSYAAAAVLMACFLIFINGMNCCHGSCGNKEKTESHGSGENHGEGHGEGHSEHH